jgi:hypothetical protein
MVIDLSSREITPLLEGVFEPNQFENQPSRSHGSESLTFSVENTFYVMELSSSEVYPLGINAASLSFYP